MQPDLSAITGELVGQIQDRARSLGLTWQLVKATVAEVDSSSQVTILLDGDTVRVGAVSMIGTLTVDLRVWVMVVPPGGLYVVGHVTAVALTDYTPGLHATVTDPDLGSSGNLQVGRYTIDPVTGWVDVQISFRFGTVGPSAGSGTYLLDMPTPVDAQTTGVATGINDIVGHGTIVEAGVGGYTVEAFLNTTTGAGGVGQVVMFAVNQTTSANVAHNAPFAWGANDGGALHCRYPAG